MHFYNSKFVLYHIPLWNVIIVFFLCSFSFAQNKYALLAISPQGPIYEQVFTGLTGDLEESFTINRLTFDSSLTTNDINTKIKAASPRAIITLGNKPIKIYREYLASFKNNKNDIPLVTLLASQMEKSIEGIDNVQGIAYETPMITAVVDFRSIFGIPITKVGVIYRSIFESFVSQQTSFCKRVKIDVISIQIGNNTKRHKQEIENALQQLIKKDKVDLFWIPNDNILLKPDLLGEVWIPTFSKNPVPVIVGVESLVKPEINLGTFAVIPDPVAMGEQAAQIILKLEKDKWQFGTVKVYPTISVYSVLNMKQAASFAKNGLLNTREVTKILKDER